MPKSRTIILWGKKTIDQFLIFYFNICLYHYCTPILFFFFLILIIFENLQDGRINYDEFVAMMRKGNPEVNPIKKRRDDVFVWLFGLMQIMQYKKWKGGKRKKIPFIWTLQHGFLHRWIRRFDYIYTVNSPCTVTIKKKRKYG